MGDSAAGNAGSDPRRITGGMLQVEIGVFRRHPAQVVRLVEAGAIVQLTRDGRPVIRIVPEPPQTDRWGPLRRPDIRAQIAMLESPPAQAHLWASVSVLIATVR
jgi:antitoxin (DNA-binding transcriptional repressor) of toxin-antitoxin stability system